MERREAKYLYVIHFYHYLPETTDVKIINKRRYAYVLSKGLSNMENIERRKTTTISLRIVDVIAELNGARLTEISNYMSIHKSTLFTHLKTLEESGYITRIDSEYYLSAKLFYLGKRAREKDEYVFVKNELDNIYNDYGYQTSFSIDQGGRIIVLFDKNHESAPEGFQVGEYYHMHTSASGKAILAEYPDEHVDEILEKWGLPEKQDNTITDREKLFDELEQIRKSGYAINNQESLEGLRSIGVAVEKPSGDVVGSIDIFGPPYLLPSDGKLVGILKDTASSVESKLEEII